MGHGTMRQELSGTEESIGKAQQFLSAVHTMLQEINTT